MIGLGLVLLIIGVILLIICQVAHLPAVAHTISIILLVVGAILLLVGFLLPALHTSTVDYDGQPRYSLTA